jgi:hypothetical protein
VQWRSCPNSSTRSTPTRRLGWSSQTYTLHSTSGQPIPANTDILHTDTEPRYTSALQSLSHVLVLTPQNPFYVLQAGETAYTAQDIPLAMRFFLRVIEMTGDDNDDAVPPPPTGITIRAWYGVELVSLLRCATQSQSPRDQTSFLVGGTSRCRTDAGHFLAVENPSTRTPIKAAQARAGGDRLSASWPARRRSKNIIELAEPTGIDRIYAVVLTLIHWLLLRVVAGTYPRDWFANV